MKLEVISDGTTLGTTVKDADTGETLTNVAGIRFAIEKGQPQAIAEVVLYVPLVRAELNTVFEKDGIYPGS